MGVLDGRLFPVARQAELPAKPEQFPKRGIQNGISPKKAGCKYRKTNHLKNTLKKD